MAGPDQVLSYHDAILYSSDVRLFKAPNWLNDSCINFYLRYLEHEECKGRPDLLFMDPAVVSCMMIQCTDDEELQDLAQGLSLDTRSVLFIPVNDSEEFFQGCTHWSLLVYEAASSIFYHLDSSAGRNGPAAVAHAAKIWKMLGGEGSPRVESVGGPQQENGYDCGMYVLMCAKTLAADVIASPSSARLNLEGLKGRVSADYVQEQRRRMPKLIETLQDA